MQNTKFWGKFRFEFCILSPTRNGLRVVSHRPENETGEKKPWFYFSGFCLFFVSHRNRENIFLVFAFQLIFLYHTDPFLQTGEIFLRFWPKMKFEKAVFSISASRILGALFHISLLEVSIFSTLSRNQYSQ